MPDGTFARPESLGIGASKCGCTEWTQDPKCRNKGLYVVDWADNKPVTLRECPNRFDDSEHWENLWVALYGLKEMEKAYSFYGVPVAHIAYPVKEELDRIFLARDRYQAQRASKLR